MKGTTRDGGREAVKAVIRLSVQQQERRVADVEEDVLRRDREDAFVVASAIQLLRVDDEALEEKQRLGDPSVSGEPAFETALYDEHSRRRYSSGFTRYGLPIDTTSSLWWPW